jgi:hypothetical protein
VSYQLSSPRRFDSYPRNDPVAGQEFHELKINTFYSAHAMHVLVVSLSSFRRFLADAE